MIFYCLISSQLLKINKNINPLNFIARCYFNFNHILIRSRWFIAICPQHFLYNFFIILYFTFCLVSNIAVNLLLFYSICYFFDCELLKRLHHTNFKINSFFYYWNQWFIYFYLILESDILYLNLQKNQCYIILIQIVRYAVSHYFCWCGEWKIIYSSLAIFYLLNHKKMQDRSF